MKMQIEIAHVRMHAKNYKKRSTVCVEWCHTHTNTPHYGVCSLSMRESRTRKTSYHAVFAPKISACVGGERMCARCVRSEHACCARSGLREESTQMVSMAFDQKLKTRRVWYSR